MAVVPRSTSVRAARSAATDLDLPTILFLASAFIAPLNVSVYRAFRLYDLLTAVIWIVLVVGPRPVRWGPRSLRLAALALLIAGLLGGFRATAPIQSVLQVGQYAFVFFVQIPVILTIARSRTVVSAAIAAFLSGYLAVVLVAFLTQQVQLAGRVVPFSSGNPNALAIPTVILVPFVLWLAFDLWWRERYLTTLVFAVTVLGLMVWSLTASASRGSTLAVVVSLVVFVVFCNGRARPRSLVLRAGALLLALAVVGGVIAWTDVFPDTLRTRIERTVGPDPGGPSVDDERLALNHAGWEAFLDSPLVGTGFDNFRYVGQFYDDAATYHDPHNVWIQFLAQTGLLGAAAFLFIIVRWFILLLRAQSWVRRAVDRQLLWAFIAAMLGLMAHSLVAPLVLHRHYWLLYGLGVAAAVELGRRTEVSRAPAAGGG